MIGVSAPSGPNQPLRPGVGCGTLWAEMDQDSTLFQKLRKSQE